jgi:hypothetical protein
MEYSKSLRLIGLLVLALVARFLLGREHGAAIGLFFFAAPLYFLLVIKFFHYEARYLTGTLVGYLPRGGYALARIPLHTRA